MTTFIFYLLGIWVMISILIGGLGDLSLSNERDIQIKCLEIGGTQEFCQKLIE